MNTPPAIIDRRRNPQRLQRAAGLLTLGALALALVVANSPLKGYYDRVHHLPVIVQVGALGIDEPLIFWINEGLMVFFFLLLGLDIKSEILAGELSGKGRFALPAVAAIGGMAAPAAIYAALNAANPEGLRGWAIPTATDVVLALTVLSLVGSRAPAGLKSFLGALAIFDDIGAIAIIALFYTEDSSGGALAAAAGAGVALLLLNRLGFTHGVPYLLTGIVLWSALLRSGVQPTLAGVAVALAIPMWRRRDAARPSPLLDAAGPLRLWVGFGVVPVFAFFNAGISFGDIGVSGLLGPISLGAGLGLLIGKQLGVFGSAFVAVRIGWARLPPGVGWRDLYGVALLAGVGFTMSLFIARLAFTTPTALAGARAGVLLASFLAAVAGIAVLGWAGRRTLPVSEPQGQPGQQT